MKLKGLRFIKKIEVYNGNLVYETKTFGLGGGEWSIEAYDRNGCVLKEFVGLNGTRDGEEPSDLWSELREWEQELAYSYKEFVAPDGATGSMSFFWREARKNNLHGCVLSL